MPARPSHPALVLIASGNEWFSRALQNILSPEEFRVLRTESLQETAREVVSREADAVVLDVELAGGRGLELCRRLSQVPDVGTTIPIFATTVGSARRQDRIEALQAGAWEYLAFPLDSEELILKLNTYMRSKRTADQARQAALVDERTGLYNVNGLLRRTEELVSQAHRYHRPFACVVFHPETPGEAATGGPGAPGAEEALDLPDLETEAGAGEDPPVNRIARAFRRSARLSDVIGIQEGGRIVVLAPDTNRSGARGLVERVGAAAATSPGGEGAKETAGVRLRAGWFALDEFDSEPPPAREILERAVLELRPAGPHTH